MTLVQQYRQCTCNVTFRGVHETTVTVENQYYIFLCVCVRVVVRMDVSVRAGALA